MDFLSNRYSFKKKIILIWSILLLGLHTVFTVLSVWYTYIGGDIQYIALDKALSFIIPIIAFILIYVRFAVLVSVYHSYREGTLPFTLVAAISLVLTRIFDLVIKSFIYVDFASVFPKELLGGLMSFMIDIAVVLLIFLFSRSRKEGTRRVTFLAVLTCIFPLFVSLSEELVIIIDFWMRDLGGKVVFTPSMAKALLLPLGEAVLGFLLIFVTHRILFKTSKAQEKK